MKGRYAMCTCHPALEMALSLLDDGIPEEALAAALACAAVPGLADLTEADLPFTVSE
jgi:hypothetical protein